MMKYDQRNWSAMFGMLTAIVVVTSGCSQSGSESGSSSTSVAEDAHDDNGHDHGGWWCAEHGVPEEECSLCSSKAANRFKEKGDWCEEHNRAKSQCFECDLSRAAKFAKLYEAKFGHAPPKLTE